VSAPHEQEPFAALDGAAIKQCCARLYESEIVSQLLGDSFHPGGVALTLHLGTMLQLAPQSLVLDAAAGKGASAMVLAGRFRCGVIGIDLSAPNVAHAAAEADRLEVADLVRFEVGDAEHLPLADESVDAIICECAFCTFPDKARAAREFARVLKPGGRIGLSDITRAPGPPGELEDLMAWIACLADALPVDEYGALMTGAGLAVTAVERHDEALRGLVSNIRARLFAVDVLAGLKKIERPSFDLQAAARMARQALAAIDEGRLGYAILTAVR
jgi:arsenite methyltransferase